MVLRGTLWVVAVVAAFGQSALPKIAPIPADPLELVNGEIQVADTAASRDAVIQLLNRARKNYTLRSGGQGYDLKISFAVSSGGQTDYDGAWQMEDISDPKLGLRWTATAAAGYTITEISSNRQSYAQGTASTVPLRLHEVRAALFGSLQIAEGLDRDFIRTSNATFHGMQVACVLLSPSGNAPVAATGRAWEEIEDCIDPQSGLLQVHSQAPGRYYAYDYSNALSLGGHVMPRKVVVTEAGKTVTEITVESLTEFPAADPGLFVPTAEMKAQGAAVLLAGAQKISRFTRPGPFVADATAQPVCVFGLLTAAGELVEVHSLQPSDPHSQAAIEAVKQMKFSSAAQPGARPSQHFIFVIEKFVASP
jgi:hypothetical protein